METLPLCHAMPALMLLPTMPSGGGSLGWAVEGCALGILYANHETWDRLPVFIDHGRQFLQTFLGEQMV